MRVAVVGTGGIGAPYGASLAKAGVDVTFVARGPHLAAIRENGLWVEGDRGETHIWPARATDDTTAIGTVDFVLFCVKLWDVENVGALLRPVIGPETAVVPLQNGVDAHERLIPILGHEAVMGGTAYVTGNIASPGVIRQTGTYQRMTFGELDGRLSQRGRQLSALCETAGFEGVFQPGHQGAAMGEVQSPGAYRRTQRADPAAARQMARGLRPTGTLRSRTSRNRRRRPRRGGATAARQCRKCERHDAVDAVLPDDLDGDRSAPWQPARITVVDRQSRRARPPSSHPDSGQRLYLCGA